jgi:hypothetical protein
MLESEKLRYTKSLFWARKGFLNWKLFSYGVGITNSD